MGERKPDSWIVEYRVPGGEWMESGRRFADRDAAVADARMRVIINSGLERRIVPLYRGEPEEVTNA
ncbi:MAG: hypothetical protein EA351_00350 [Gemmatimonadales bacterium]|nr:MAG: hypothetical protein EA351_00350 [Gemmatimonadales bacterium]